MTGEVIKSFLVGLGFGVDEGDLAKFNKAIATASLRVTALYATVKIAAAGIVYGISEISEGFEKMGYEYRIIAPAINKALILRRELLKAYSAAGINITKVVQNSVRLNMSLTKTKYALEAIYKSVGSRFFELLTKQSDAFRKKIYENMPKIQNALERFIKFIFKALEATTALGLRLWSILTRVYDFFVMLDKATDGWSTIILGVIAAWKLLNLSFLATPLGMLLAGFVALLALYDDFKTFQEGGKSLFDWSAALPIIEAITRYMGMLYDGGVKLVGIFQTFGVVIGGIFSAFSQLINGNFRNFLDDILLTLNQIVELFYKLIGFKNGTAGATAFAGAVGSKISDFFSGGNSQQNLQNNPVGKPLGNPVGSNIQNSATNQNVHQQTNINVTSSADANSVGKSVAGEQTRVNFDMARNMKPAAR